MSFDTFFDNAENTLADIFTVSATHTSLGAVDTACHVNIEHDTVIQPDDFTTNAVEIGTTLEYFYKTLGVVEIGSTFLVDSNTYTVKRIESNDKTFVRVVVK